MNDSELPHKGGSILLRGIRMFFPAQPYSPSKDKILGGVGAFVAVFGLVAGSHYFAPQLTIPVVAPMGASAVLFFAAPHSPLAQPWPFVGGHLLSAVLGVSCYTLIPDTFTAATTAVSLAIVFILDPAVDRSLDILCD